jgi:hypothetical protein
MVTKHGFPPDDGFPVVLSEAAKEPEEPGLDDAALSMATKHGLPPDNRFPLVLFEYAKESEAPGWDEDIIWSLILKTSIAALTAAVIALLLVGHPAAPFANVTASLLDLSPFQPGRGRPTPTIRSTASAQALLPAATDAPTRDQVAAALEAGNRSESEIGQPPAEAPLKQFQAWAAEEDARAQLVQPVQDVPADVGSVQPVQDAQAPAVQDAKAQDVKAQDARAQVAQDDPEEVRPVQRRRHLRHVRNARAEIRQSPRAEIRPRARVRRQQIAREQARPATDARTLDRPAQNAQPPSLLQSLGLQQD